MSRRGNIGLFSSTERRKWQKYLLNLPEICRAQNWNKRYSVELEHKLNQLSNAQHQSVKQKFGFANNATTTDILNDKKKAITLYCFWRFSKIYRSSIGRYLSLMNITGRALQKSAFIGSLNLSEEESDGIVLFHYWRKTAIYEREYSLKDASEDAITILNRKAKRLAAVLSRGAFRPTEIHEKTYHFKLFGRFKDYVIYWFLRLKSDDEEPSYPFNQRQKKFANKIVAIDLVNKKLHLVVHNPRERRIILSFLQKNLGLELWFEQANVQVSKAQFSSIFTSDEVTDGIPVISAYYRKTNLPGHPKLLIQDSPGRSSVKNAILKLVEQHDITPDEISNVSNFNILFNGQSIKIKILPGKFGYYKFSVPERTIAFQDREKLLLTFEKQTKVPINKYFVFEGKPIDVKEAINDLLNSRLISLSDEPPIFRQVLEELYAMGLLQKPEKENKRYCVGKCTKQYVTTWEKGYCSECGGKMRISGEYFSVRTDKVRIKATILEELRADGFQVVSAIRRFNKKKYELLEVYTPKGSVIVVPIQSTKIDSNLLQHLKYNDASVIFVPYPHTSETQIIRDNGHGVATLTEIISSKLQNAQQRPLKDEINSCLNNLQRRIDSNCKNALERIEQNDPSYDFHKFEEDIYAIFHFILPSAQRLGDQFIGKRVSDGIAAVPLTTDTRFCITWDCKYSESRYALNDPPRKIIRYLETLSQLPVVKNFGGLESFVFISNNLPEKKFKRLSKKVKRKYKWSGRMILFTNKQLISVCKHFREIQQSLLSSPESNLKYYQNLSKLFIKPRRKIYSISDEEVASLTGDNYTSSTFNITRNDVL